MFRGQTAGEAKGTMSPETKAMVDRFSVSLFVLAWVTALAVHTPSLLAQNLLIAGPIGLLTGYLLADFLAGAVHWLADRYFDPKTPVLGPMLIAPFREHHRDPASIGRHDFFEVSGNNALATAPVALVLLALPKSFDFASALLCVFGFSLTLSLVATNQFHGWAHSEHPPRIARQLHRAGLILTPVRHAEHHANGYDRAYCVTSGWLNPLLDRSRFFPRVERAIASATRTTSSPNSALLRSSAPPRGRVPNPAQLAPTPEDHAPSGDGCAPLNG